MGCLPISTVTNAAPMFCGSALDLVILLCVVKSVLVNCWALWQDQGCRPQGCPRYINPKCSFNDVTVRDCHINKPYKDAQNRLLWKDKTCLACTQLIMSWKALLLILLLLFGNVGCFCQTWHAFCEISRDPSLDMSDRLPVHMLRQYGKTCLP